MRHRALNIACAVFFLVCLVLATRTLVEKEQRKEEERIWHQGNSLVSLLALQPLEHFRHTQGDLLQRTLAEYLRPKGLVYCLVHDAQGETIASFGSRALLQHIPPGVREEALLTLGYTSQVFRPPDIETSVHEFSKPLFEDGQRAGTIRLGLQAAPVSVFSLPIILLLAIIVLCAIATILLVHYGHVHVLARLQRFLNNLRSLPRDSGSTETHPLQRLGYAQALRDLEESLQLVETRTRELDRKNCELKTKIGAMVFQKTRIANILDSLQFGILVSDLHDNLVHINQYMVNLLNVNRTAMLHRPILEAIEHAEIRAYLTQQGAGNLCVQDSREEIHFAETAPDRLFVLSSTYLRDDEGTAVGKIHTLKDVTNEALSERAQKEFLAHVTHELLTPVTTIKSYNEMLMDGEVHDEATQSEFYNTIMQEAQRLQDLIQNLLNIAKIEMGGMSLTRTLVRGDAFARDCVTAVETAARKKHISLEAHMGDNPPNIFADKELLKVALINVLGNAVKYTPEHGKVVFSFTVENGMAAFDVEDTGYGIAPEDLPHIFEKFFRSGNGDIVRQNGTGLGLHITRQIVTLHGGEIEARSELEKGTQFTIRIPREEYHIGKR